MKFFILILIALMAFSLGFKVGENNGYKDGFDEGYSYDCRAELGKVAEFVYSIKKDLKDTRDSVHVVRQNLRSAVITKKEAELDSLISSGVKDTTLDFVDENGQRHLMSKSVLGSRKSRKNR